MKMNPDERWHPKEKETQPILSRRKFIIGGALGLAGLAKLSKLSNEDKWANEKVDADATLSGPAASSESSEGFLELKENKREYDTREIAGRPFGYPISAYFGTKDRIGPVTLVDFRYRLAQLWKEKMMRLRVSEKERPALAHAIDDIVMSYDPDKAMTMSAGAYYLELTDSLSGVRAEVDWDKIHRAFRFSGPQNALFRSFAQNIDAKTLLAFNLSEIMPSQGNLTFKVFDTLLKTGGYEFISRIPSGGDDEMSYGPGQITAKIFQEEKNKRGSVAKMAGMLKRPDMITKDIAQVRDRQHHMASYLDALFNIGLLVQKLKLSDEQATALVREPVGDDVRMFISGAHNRPADAIDSFERFAKAYVAARKQGGQARPRFITFCTQRIAPYVGRTLANLEEVRRQGSLG
ncbi:hypothetical protein A3C20_01595 [Candidatus Kaiserbacteria bacterium RIFCSPHIGHO2_02_FULL_55_25]|uniref:Uncharacterized protein n=1 Tax=Candidatus Kaiserbacteria bacterium RIFCSPHIGHO2_02_FULL_55_25 TaxID=1798498 RepID=A0A1F6EA85_9BACT|nr:MAG: hypothetical protein A2764_03430 [Candidatus Kaiserbacteria bacterium RIFCSPHIGHO2_01_FULL_55_79]OGG70490.1 MAG: hypothetical protein A3C20_01595 [Candidatus Kaiserbacteria bacterium RIFCSPHIGHO2_02_FULL_55_25]OGG77476.1 MAG: hypothetical protein A3F56_01230 [Candidatus Kaiserbacteria bacterium RIFCSPHIGHO2_12_FULL_55_13]OGG82899.1 MAG: hypothetical protein A3A42_01075 [Candidatus Kaiserbacteria bacterium RIFCSPLOWO2_01_FULL_55_25]